MLTGQCQFQLLVGLIDTEIALVHLQFHLLTGLLQLQGGNGGSTLGSTYLISYVSPVPDRHTHHDGNIPGTTQLPLEAIIHIGVRSRIATYQQHLRQMTCFQHVGGLMSNIHHILQHLQLRTILQIILFLEYIYSGGSSQLLCLFVNQRHLFIDRQSTELTQQHLRQRQTIVDLHDCHLSLVDLHADAQSFGTCSHTFTNHLLHVSVKFLHQIKISLGQFLLMMERHHLPVGLVYLIERFLATSIGRVGGKVFTNICYLV